MNTATGQIIQGFRNKHKIDEGFESTALSWFIPTAELIYNHQLRANTPFFVGVNGSQGSGKSTLTDFIKQYLTEKYDLTIAVLSLDDFYYSQRMRQKLAQSLHPLLATRGVPGTHNTELMAKVLSKLKQGLNVQLPRFNKATDNPHPVADWPEVTKQVDIVVLEGWCWGTPAQQQDALLTAVNSLEQEEDNNGKWRNYVNQQLTAEYEPLYSLFDFWLMLKAPSFDCVASWRTQQEHKLKQATQGQANHGVMADEEITRFIQHYQRLTEHSLSLLPAKTHLTFSLDENRNILAATGKDQLEFNQYKQAEV